MTPVTASVMVTRAKAKAASLKVARVTALVTKNF
jgi:hypothetical protein